MSRKLASIRTVSRIAPIEGADAIELAIIDGWQCVVRKGEFCQGDKGVYFEIDSFLPVEPRYEFLRKSSFKTVNDVEGFRLKTVKLRGQLSQGLILPMSMFPELPDETEGTDVTEVLKIEKYDPPVPPQLRGLVEGLFPAFIPKTDAERIQNLPEYFVTYRSEEFEVTEKLDGMSMTVYVAEGKLGVCSRNLELKRSEDNTLWNITIQSGLGDYLLGLGRDLALQGELVGEGIQKNPLGIRGQFLYIFGIWDIQRKAYLTAQERKVFCTHLLKTVDKFVGHVPVISDSMRVFEALPTMQHVLTAADGKSLVNPKVDREGLVFKGIKQTSTIFKAVGNRYLLRND